MGSRHAFKLVTVSSDVTTVRPLMNFDDLKNRGCESGLGTQQ
jgi:hypothetical protein